MLDLISSVFSLLATYYFIRLKSQAWYFSFLACFLNGILYWRSGLFADTLLEVFYFLSSCYGCYLWLNKKHRERKPLQLNQVQWLLVFLLIGISYCLISLFLSSYTSSTVPRMDAITTSLSLLAQWLMCHKIIQTWIFWIVTDLLYAIMYHTKQLPYHCFLMILYSCLGLIGYWSWLQSTHKMTEANKTLNQNYI